MHIEDFILRIFVAVFCGALIGLERQWINRIAGIQTNMLVAVGACLFLLSSFVPGQDANSSSRIGAQVVSGIGFLGGGMIFKEGFNAHGINTAATIWCSAAIGLLAGMGLYSYAVAGTGFIILGNTLFRYLDHLISKIRRPLDKRIRRHYELKILAPFSLLHEIKANALDIIAKYPENDIYSVKSIILKGQMVDILVHFNSSNLNKHLIKEITREIEKTSANVLVDWTLL